MDLGPRSRPLDALAARPMGLVGALFVCLGLANAALWSVGAGAPAVTALRAGRLALAADGFGGYVAVHPAYVLAFLAGALVVARGER